MISSRRAFHFALRWGSSLVAVRGIGSDGTGTSPKVYWTGRYTCDGKDPA